MWDWKNSPPSIPGDPKKFLKLVLAISFGLLVLWVFVMAQTERSDRQSVSVEEQQRLDSLRQSLGTEGEPAEQRSDSQGMFFNAVTTFLILGGIGLAFWWWYSRKLSGTQQGVGSSGPVANVIGSQQIGMGQEIKVIEINEEYWVLGISNQSVNLLHRYQKSEWKSAEAFTGSSSEKEDSSFSRILSSLQQKK